MAKIEISPLTETGAAHPAGCPYVAEAPLSQSLARTQERCRS